MSEERLSLTDLPDPDNRDAVFQFARSFKGYQVFGSFRACADAAEAKRRETLADIRNELFFEYRFCNHTGEFESILDLYRELLPHFRRLMREDAAPT